METPIFDFVRQYVRSGALRLHMPGHKGKPFLGMEPLDITEINGADSLHEADGIIRQSEANASRLFGCETYYSTEGSSQCIRAMLYLAMLHAKQRGRSPLIAAGRNAHKTFLSAVALLDLDVMWLYPQGEDSYLSCNVRSWELEKILKGAEQKPTALYLTSPDYLGNLADVDGIARVCRRHGILLLVDNAHGAYLRFLEPSQHPINLGADLCCDSAHKTLPVLTGGAYLHISRNVSQMLSGQVRQALALFGSTSPSYLILQSLDAANAYLEEYAQKLKEFVPLIWKLKEELEDGGYRLYGQEPLKLTISAKEYGYRGKELADILMHQNMVCEFADPDYLVLMLTPETGEDGIRRLKETLLAIPRRPPAEQRPPVFQPGERVLSVREAMLSLSETIPAAESEGRILASASVGCPPAVPILICGERIDSHTVECFRYYGVEYVSVIREA